MCLFSQIRVDIVKQGVEVRLEGEAVAQHRIVLLIKTIGVGIFEKLKPSVIEREHRCHLCHIGCAEIADGDA